MGTPLCFPPFYKKRNEYFDILLASLDKKSFQNGVYFSKMFALVE